MAQQSHYDRKVAQYHEKLNRLRAEAELANKEGRKEDLRRLNDEIDDHEDSFSASEGDKYRYDRPEDIQYQSAYDPRTMSMEPEMQKRLDAIQMDKRGLDKFRGEALRSGESAWASLAKRGVAMDAQTQMEQMLRGAQGRAAEARSGMARRGGIGSGSQERLGRMAMKEGLLAQQGSYRDKNRGMLEIGMADEKNRISQLGQLPEMEIAAMRPEFEKTSLWSKGKQFDLGNQIKEGQDRNTFNLGMWQEKMKEWGAGQTAAAQAEAGK